MSHQAVMQPALESRESESPAVAFEQVLNTEEAAALLQIHPKTLQKMAREGTVPAFRIGDLWALSGLSGVGPGRVVPFWRMLNAPLVPLTRKEGFRCSRATRYQLVAPLVQSEPNREFVHAIKGEIGDTKANVVVGRIS